MKLSLICSALKTAIDANAFFAAQTSPTVKPQVQCIIDDGTQHAAIEAELRGNGFVVVIPPILAGTNQDSGQHSRTLQSEAECVVRILCNPAQNADTNTGAQRNIYEAIEAATGAVLDILPTQGNKRFQAAPNFLQLISVDEGLLGYDITFSKLSTVN